MDLREVDHGTLGDGPWNPGRWIKEPQELRDGNTNPQGLICQENPL